jgi:uncharacterized protein YijF (DUF1287 family)
MIYEYCLPEQDAWLQKERVSTLMAWFHEQSDVQFHVLSDEWDAMVWVHEPSDAQLQKERVSTLMAWFHEQSDVRFHVLSDEWDAMAWVHEQSDAQFHE